MKNFRKGFFSYISAIFFLLLPFASFAQEYYVDITNNTGYTITELYISPTTSEDWEADILDGSTINAGDTRRVDLTGYESPLFDIKLVDVDGDSYTYMSVDVSERDIVATLDDLDSDQDNSQQISEEQERQIAEAERLAREEERLQREREEEERRRFLASPEGQRQLAEQADRERQQREAREREAREENERIAREYPFYALVTCGFRGQHVNVMACFSGDVDTELELTNGSDYGLYKVYQLHDLGQESSEGLRIDLRQSFAIKVQNSSSDLILGLKIVSRNGETLYQRQVSRFGVASARN